MTARLLPGLPVLLLALTSAMPAAGSRSFERRKLLQSTLNNCESQAEASAVQGLVNPVTPCLTPFLTLADVLAPMSCLARCIPRASRTPGRGLVHTAMPC